MKTVKLILSVFTVVSAIACNDIVESAETLVFPKKEIILTATREGLDPGTKSFRLDDGSVWWSPAEEVSVFYGSGSNGGSKFVSMNTSIAETVELQGSVQMSGSGKDFWAVYPYSVNNSCDGSSITTSIPYRQAGVEGNFSNEVFPTVAKSSSLSLAFWNICGGIKFFVSRSDIKSVTFKGNNNEPLAGKVKVAFNTEGAPTITEIIDAKPVVTIVAPNGTFKVGKYYYITLLPAELKSGFTMTFETETSRGTVSSDNAQEIKRSLFGVLKNIDSKVSEWDSTVVEPEWVDLGLSVKWATFNVGATKPEEYGDYFAWGETEPKTTYNWSTYKWCSGSSSTLTKYNTNSSRGTVDDKTVLDPEDDAAQVNWGSTWRMPTRGEWTELLNNCTLTWTNTYNGTGVDGLIVTSNKSGYTNKSIFFPSAGYRGGGNLYKAGSGGYCWSSSLDTSGPSFACGFQFYSHDVSRYSIRYEGCSVRPVYDDRIYPESVSLNKPSITLYVGDSEQLTATIFPGNASDKTITWFSDNTAVATVDSGGLVTAVASGTATITAYASSGVSDSCAVTVTPADDGVIKTADQLIAYLANPCNDAELGANIDLSGKTFTPGKQSGTFDGKNFTITYNAEVTDRIPAEVPEGTDKALLPEANVGLFSFVGGTVKNLKTAGSLKFSAEAGSGTYHVGGIAGYVEGTGKILNCVNGVNVLADTKCTHHLGGIAGFTAAGASITGCVNNGKVEMIIPEKGAANASQVGGIIGHIEAKTLVDGCTNNAKITWEGTGTPRQGGICGRINNLVDVKFIDCTNKGDVVWNEGNYNAVSWSYVGGLTGHYDTPTKGGQVLYENCTNEGKVTCNIDDTKSKARVGGIACHAGIATGNGIEDGEIKYTFKNCVNNGDITTTSTTAFLGGIVGYSEVTALLNIEGCTNNATLTAAGKGSVGAILGRNCSVKSTFTDVKVGKDTKLSLGDAAGFVGLIAGWQPLITTAITGKVAGGTLVKGSETIEITAANFADYLLGKDSQALGEGGSITGVTFGE